MVLDKKMIYGEQIILRPYEVGFHDDEVYQMYQWSRNEAVLRWSGGSVLVMSYEDFKGAFQSESLRRDKHRQFFALLTNTGKLIGRLGYYNIDLRHSEAELGIVIGEQEFWGQGHGTDAIKTLLAHIFTETDLNRIYLNTYIENDRAKRCFSKCGFRELGQHSKFSLDRGAHVETKMEIYRNEWIAQQTRTAINKMIEGGRS